MTLFEQPTFEGFKPMRAPRDRLFFAIRPPPDVAAQMVRLAQRLRADFGLTGRPTQVSRLHATLYALTPRRGAPEALVEGLRRAAGGLEFQPFEVTFDAAESFLSKPIDRPLVLRGDPSALSILIAFRRRLVEALSATGLAEPEAATGFTPHVTLLYDDKGVPPTSVDPVRWMVREFVLIRSHIRLTRHDELGRWPM